MDAYLCSYPKSGRTWMRFALTNLLQERYEVQGNFTLENMFSIIPNDDGSKSQPQKEVSFYKFADLDIPKIAMTHKLWEERFQYLPIVFLLRNPADVLVSRYYHMRFHQERITTGIEEFVLSEEGASRLVGYLSSWAEHLRDDNVSLFTYEALRKDPEALFAKLAKDLGIRGATKEQVAMALSKSSVQNMRRLEKAHGIGEPNPYDLENENALRVRKAEVGGFRKELPQESLSYLLDLIEQEQKVKELLLEENVYPAF